MSISCKKDLNFIALIAIVIGSQIGSGAFTLPTLLAPTKTIGLLGWLVSVSGAIALALVFSDLASHLPKNGGPHVYVAEAFGKGASFFTAWVYWIISWSSSSILLITAIGYLTTITGPLSTITILLLETSILLLITYVNIIGMKFSGIIETILTGCKLAPLIVLPFIFFMFFDLDYFKIPLKEAVDDTDILSIITKTALLTFWGFIGVECATTPAESVCNPKKTIPRAIIIGTSCVAIIYIVNTVSVVGVVGFDVLAASKAPYAVVMNRIFAHSSDIAISIMAIIVCIGTLNAWTLTSGQIASGAYSDGLFPKIFGKTNRSGAPTMALLISAFGMIPFLCIEQMECWKNGLEKLIDLLVSIFIYVYLICCISYMKLISRWKQKRSEKIKAQVLAQIAAIFCIFVLSHDMISSIIVLGVFIAAGIPVLYSRRKKCAAEAIKMEE
ncbi:MAG: amino acid permease [Holosporales bacterium]|jgi:APA family basic amino acid/polyamine antiporter|nr:amino acid permease [Holosporales bacterium]